MLKTENAPLPSSSAITAPAITIDRIEAFALAVRPSVGPVSSLGNMPVRNAVLVAITSRDGITGWGEVWCNFPPRGNLTRLNLLEDVIAPLILGKTYASYEMCRADLDLRSARMAIHTGEFGPFQHCLAGVDTALADLAAKSLNMPLAQFLTNRPLDRVPTYASTPNVNDLDNALSEILEMGHTGIKLKIGLGLETDLELCRNVHEFADTRLQIFADANQNWSLESAAETIRAISKHINIGFIEEPLMADAPLADWAELASLTDVPLAGGENITSYASFQSFLKKGGLRVAQPDVAKWGGVSGAFDIGKLAANHGITCAMHYMGSGLGLAASIHTLAAIGGDGPVELDANPNPLRTDLGDIDLTINKGSMHIPMGIGHGFTPDPSALKAMCVARFSAK